MTKTELVCVAAVLLVSGCIPSDFGFSVQTRTPSPNPTPAPLEPTPTLPATALPTATPESSAPLIETSLTSLARTLHPYPDSASYTESWIDAAILIWGAGDGGGSLLAFDWDKLEYRPAMAREMPKVSSDNTVFTFSLRDDLKWTDGSPITADDFTFAWDNASREENHYVQFDLLQDIAAFRAPDAHTLELALKSPRPRSLALGIVNTVTPVPKKVWQGKPWNDPIANPEILRPSVVLGPFALQEFKTDDHATFTAINTYYVGRPQVPQVMLLPSQQPGAAYAALKNGQANWVHPLSPSNYQDAKADHTVSVQEWLPANAAYRVIEFNMARPFLADKRVREALARAVNRAELVEQADSGLGTPQYGFIQPSDQKWVNPNLDKYDVDLGRAKQLLHDAGYSLQGGTLIGKDSQPVTLQVVYPTSSAPRARIAAYLQQQYKQLGISVEIKGLDFNSFTDQVQNRHDFEISLGTYGGGALDPDLGPKAQLISTGQQNVTGYANPQVDDLFRQASTELDDAKRKQLYDRIQELVNTDLPVQYLYALKAVDALSVKVRGVAPRRGDRLDYNDAILGWSVAR